MNKRFALAALALAAILPSAFAADWPAKTISLVVPFPAGGSADAVARLIAQRLGEKLGQSVVVENRAGAGGNLGTDVVAKAASDGHTIGLSTSGPLANNKFLYKNMPFDPLKDLTPVIAVGEIPVVLAANPALKINNLKDFLDQARARPGKLSMAHPGNGTIGHLAVELVKSQGKVQALAVPYKGDTPAITDTIGGAVDTLVIPVTALMPHLQAGKLKGVAILSRQRLPGLPDLPTAIEQGVQAEGAVWYAIVGPRNLPAPVVDRLNKEINAILATPEAKAKLAQFGGAPMGGTAEQLGRLMSTDSVKWQKVIEDARITLE